MNRLKPKFRYLSALVLALSFQLTAFAQQQEEQIFNSVDYDDKTWSVFTANSGRFSVELPGKPRERTVSTATASGDVSLHYFMLAVMFKSTFALCTVIYNDFPTEITDDANVRKVLDAGRDSLLAEKTSRKVLTEKELRSAGYLVREITFEDGDLMAFQRFLLVKNRLYQINVTWPKDSKAPKDVLDFHETVLKRFFDSFKFVSSNG